MLTNQFVIVVLLFITQSAVNYFISKVVLMLSYQVL